MTTIFMMDIPFVLGARVAVPDGEQVGVDLVLMREHVGEQIVERLDGLTVGVRLGLHEARPCRRDLHRPGRAGRSVTAEVERDLDAAGGVADDRDVVKVEHPR
jgi:hypothetical protein